MSELTFVEVERRMPLMQLPCRTVVMQLQSARVLFSPASTLTAQHLRDAGAVTDIVGPSLLHLEGGPAAVAAHPSARLWGPKGAVKKQPGHEWAVLGMEPWPFEGELAHVALEGMPTVRESVFLHRASGSLLVTDLAFHIDQPRGFGPWLLLSLFGTHGRFGVSRLFARMVKDKAAFERSLDAVLALDFDRLVPAHGTVVESGAKAALRAALRERGFRA